MNRSRTHATLDSITASLVSHLGIAPADARRMVRVQLDAIATLAADVARREGIPLGEARVGEAVSA